MGLYNYKKPDNSYTIDATLKEISEGFAVLSSSCNIDFKWSVSKLPANLVAGDKVKLRIITEQMEEDEKNTQLRALLNEIVN